jgi:hypothetical protein
VLYQAALTACCEPIHAELAPSDARVSSLALLTGYSKTIHTCVFRNVALSNGKMGNPPRADKGWVRLPRSPCLPASSRLPRSKISGSKHRLLRRAVSSADKYEGRETRLAEAPLGSASRLGRRRP